MKVKNSNMLTKLASIVGVTGVSLLVSFPAEAEKLNPSPSIFTEAPYSRSQRINANSQYIPSDISGETTVVNAKENAKQSQQRVIAQTTNPSPSIFQECPYNRSACTPSGTTAPVEPPASEPPATTPSETPTEIPTEMPPMETPTEIPGETPETDDSSSGATDGKNIVAVAEANGSFKTLTKALKAAGLVETLQGSGPFTVFAPTDAAFAELPQDAVEDLLKPENKEVLVKILTYHVVNGKVLSSDLQSGEVKSIEGGPINVRVGEGVMVNDANVSQADIVTENGVIHVIDKVILPPDL